MFWASDSIIKRFSRCVVLAFFCVVLVQSTNAAEISQEQPVIPAKVETSGPAKGLAELIPYAIELSRRFTDLQQNIARISNPNRLKDRLTEIARNVEDLSWDIILLRNAPQQDYNQLAYFREKLSQQNDVLEKIEKILSQDVLQLMSWKNSWNREKRELPKWRAGVQAEGDFDTVKKTLDNIEKTIDEALQLIEQKLKPILVAEQSMGELLVKIHALDVEIESLMATIREIDLRRKRESMFSPTFYSKFNRDLWLDAWHGIVTFSQQQIRLFRERGWIVAAVIAVWLILALLISETGRLMEEPPKWQIFTERPLAAGAFICIAVIGISAEKLPPGWRPAMQFAIIVAVMRLAGGLVQVEWKKQLINHLAALLLLAALLQMVSLPFQLLRLIVFLVALAGTIYCLRQELQRDRQRVSWLIVCCLRLAFMVFLITLLAEISGYADFADYFLSSCLMTGFAALNIWMLFLILSGAIELAFFKSPLSIIRRNASALVSLLNPLLVVALALFFLTAALVVWKVYPTKKDALESLLSFGITYGKTNISLGVTLAAAAILYLSSLTSRGVQNLLLNEVLPRSGVERGVRFSITRLVNYAIYLVGFLLALEALGFGLTNLTIIGGALGVGIGFGLQAIVNNFASGLILLFERPIKVGDVIQLGTEIAEVKKLGLRATVVQTRDNAEVVVPNSHLITNQVTNWTLSERRIRIKLPVGVAYGSDVSKVMQILMSCAIEHPKVLRKPAPRVFFLQFGDSSLNFEVRVWIDEFVDRRIVQSELNQKIEQAFRTEGIEIPFPQTDLHLRSVDEAAALSLKWVEKED